MTLPTDGPLAPFEAAVVAQLLRGEGRGIEVLAAVREALETIARDAEVGVAALMADLALLSAFYQNADLLPVDSHDEAARVATAVLEATGRLSGP